MSEYLGYLAIIPTKCSGAAVLAKNMKSRIYSSAFLGLLTNSLIQAISSNHFPFGRRLTSMAGTRCGSASPGNTNGCVKKVP